MLMSASASALDFSAYAIGDYISPSGKLFTKKEREEGAITELRRFKISAGLPLFKHFEAKVSAEWDTGKSRFEIDDAYLSYEFGESQSWEVTLGRLKEPFGLENDQSLKDQFLMERSAATELFSFGRNLGLAVGLETGNWNLQAAYLNADEDPESNSVDVFSTRAFYGNEVDGHRVVHLGLSYSGRNLKDDSYQPEAPLISSFAKDQIKSAKYNTHAIDNISLEGALQFENVILQGERFAQIVVDQEGLDYYFHGFYVTGALNLFGKKRDYSKGEFEIDKDDWQMELAYRYTYVNLTAEIKADIARVHEIALNNYFLDRYRFSLQYSYADKKDWSDSGKVSRENGSTLSARLQVIFF